LATTVRQQGASTEQRQTQHALMGFCSSERSLEVNFEVQHH
jgi:hypothetical protein